jgi:hypothetical protein
MDKERRIEALSWLMMTEHGNSAFDERDADTGNPTPRDIPMSAARHVALATLATLSERYGLGELVGYDQQERDALVDELTYIAEAATGPGPFNINVALALNEQHRTAELSKLYYSLQYNPQIDRIVVISGNDDAVKLKDTVITTVVEPKSDCLFEALRDQLTLRTAPQEHNNGSK